MRPLIIPLLCLIFSKLQYAQSKFIYVDSLSTTPIDGCGLTVSTPCPTIYSGFLAANSSDTILLESGLYTGMGNEALTTANLTITSINILGNGPQSTVIIQCGINLRFLYAQNNFLESITNITIKNCSSFGRAVFFNQDGGGLLVTDSPNKIVITDTTFEKNIGFNGGGISISEGSLTIIRCTFLENKAGYWGGAILAKDTGVTILNSLFIGNEARGDLIEDTQVIIDTAEAGRGGGIYSNGGSRMMVQDCTFISNSGQVAGGAIHAKLAPAADIWGCLFLKNSALGGQECSADNLCSIRGGALFITDITLSLLNCTFIGNQAITTDISQFSQGGAMVIAMDTFAGPSIKSTVSNCTFINNTVKGLEDNNAGGYGGAIYTSQVPFILSNSTFFGNRAESQGYFTEYVACGGALYISSTTDGEITNNLFEGNIVNSGKGGAIYLTESSTISLKYNTYTFNIVYSSYVFKAQGGAIAVGHSSFANIVSCTFSQNMAMPKIGVYPMTYSGFGGGIFFQSSDGNITNCVFSLNVAISGQFDSGAVGGAVAAENAKSVQLYTNTFMYNSAQGFSGSNAYSNSGSGGAVMSLFSSITISQCMFRGNWVSAGGSQYSIGGAVAVFYDYDSGDGLETISTVIINSCEFVENIAGGEVCGSSSSPMYRAGQGGAVGIIGFSEGSVLISNTTFTSNLATTDSQGIVTSFGGAIMYTLGSRLLCSDCTFINNLAWNGLGDDICSGYDDSQDPTIVMSLKLSNPYLDGATRDEAELIHDKLAEVVAELCSNFGDLNFDITSIVEQSFASQPMVENVQRDAVSIQLRNNFLNHFDSSKLKPKFQESSSNQRVRNKRAPSSRLEYLLYSRRSEVVDNPTGVSYMQRRLARNSEARIFPNILIMSGEGSIYQPEFNSTYEICGGDALSLLIRLAQGGVETASEIQYLAHQPALTIVGSIRAANLVVVGLTANITVVDQYNDQPVILSALILINSTFAFSNNMTVRNMLILGSILTSYVPQSLSNATQSKIQFLNINGTMSTGLVKNGIFPDNSFFEKLLFLYNFIPVTILRGCVLKIYGELRFAKSRVTEINETLTTSTYLHLENKSSIIILTNGNLLVYTASFITSDNPNGLSLLNYGTMNLSISDTPSYLNPLSIEGIFTQRSSGITKITISNSEYFTPSLVTTTNETILGNIEILAQDGTKYIPSTDKYDSPTNWSIFQFSLPRPRPDGAVARYTFPTGVDFDRVVTLNDENIDDLEIVSHYKVDLSSIPSAAEFQTPYNQVFITSALSCPNRYSAYSIPPENVGDDDYMCYLCLQNNSCGYCGTKMGGCVNPGTSCKGDYEKKTENCCPRMCRGRGSCKHKNKHTTYECDCGLFYDGVSCENLSVLTYLLIAGAVFIFLIGLITLRYYYYYRRQKTKVLQELRAGLLIGSADDPGAENRSYIQAIQQDLILRDVFVNYDEIVFEGKIGEGSFGEVFKATFRGAQVAVKQMRAPVFMQLSDKDIEEFRSEAYMMSRLRHPNIVLVMGISIVSFPKPAPPPGFDDDDMVMGGGNKDGSQERSRSMSKDRKGKDKDKDGDMIRSICIITEYLEQGSLADILYGGNRVADEFWTYELVLTCALQAARGMLYLHSHQPPICHRDLKSSNLVVDDHWVVKVTDFGMSRIIPEKIQDIEKGVNGPEERSPEKPPKKARGGKGSEGDDGGEGKGDDGENGGEGGGEGMESKNGMTNGGNHETSSSDVLETNEVSEKKKRVNFNEEANVSWERESILNPDDSTERHSNLLMTSNLGTTAWCAPELLTTTIKARYTVKVDVYSYGMVLWELWERKRPYEELYSRFDIIDAVRAGRRPAIGSSCPAVYRSLIQRCWHEQPARRPTFAYIVRYLKDELAHIKRQRTTSTSAQAVSPLHQVLAHGRLNSTEQYPFQDSNGSYGQQQPNVEKEKKILSWNFMSPITALANLTSNQNETEKKIARDSDTIVSAPTAPASRHNFNDEETTTRSTFSYMPRQGHPPTAALAVPQKPTQENLDVLAASPWTNGEYMEEPPKQSTATVWRDKYVLKFSGWNQSKPDNGLPPSLAPRPLTTAVTSPIPLPAPPPPPPPSEPHLERNESDSQDDSSDDTSPKYSSFVDARGADGEPLPAEATVELDTYSSTNSVL